MKLCGLRWGGSLSRTKLEAIACRIQDKQSDSEGGYCGEHIRGDDQPPGGSGSTQ